MTGHPVGLADIAALADPVRRAIYLSLQDGTCPQSRREVAERLELPLEITRFHLDRLEREGLIISEVSPEERGPRLGRPSKRYSPASRIEVTLPPRRFDLLGRIALRALSAIPGAGPALADTAYELGADVAKGTGKPGCGGIDILGELGFQPFRDGDHVRLRNCPFHELVEEDIDLVCGINLRFMEGLASGVAEDLGRPILDPGPNRCCVSFKSRDFT